MLERTIVSLKRGQLRAIRASARAQGISVAELIRRLVAAHLDAGARVARPPKAVFERIVALGSSGRADVSDQHDSRLAGALRDEHAR